MTAAIERSDRRTTHFVNLASIHLLASPTLALNLLRVTLPFCQESNDMHRILNVPVRSKLALDVLVSEHTHVRWKMFAVSSEDTSVQWDWREESHWDRFEAGGLSANRRRDGQEAVESSHGAMNPDLEVEL